MKLKLKTILQKKKDPYFSSMKHPKSSKNFQNSQKNKREMKSVLKPIESTNNLIDQNTFRKAELNITLQNIKNTLSKRDVIRKLYDIHNSKNSTRIILPYAGKDTDPHLCYEILQYGLELFGSHNCSPIFIGGDQKTMSLAFRLKSNTITSISTM